MGFVSHLPLDNYCITTYIFSCVKEVFFFMIVINKRISFCTWNVNGLNSKILGDKTKCRAFLAVINKHDFVILTETWTTSFPEIEGYKHKYVHRSTENKNSGRRSGGVIILYKKHFDIEVN